MLAGRTALYIDTISAIQSQVTAGNVRAKLEAVGVEIQGGAPHEYAAVIKSNLVKWGKVVKEACILPD